MRRRRKQKSKRRNFRRLMGYSMLMGGTGLIAGKLPSPAKEPVQVVATRGSEYVVPMAAVTGAGIAVRQLHTLDDINSKIKKKRKGGRK